MALRLDAGWFRCMGAPDSEGSALAFRSWYITRPTRTQRDALVQTAELIFDCSEASVSQYLGNNFDKLGDALIAGLAGLSAELGMAGPPRRPKPRGKRHGVILMTQLRDVASPRFHLEAAASLVEAGAERGHSVAIHAPVVEAGCRGRQLARLLVMRPPRALIYLRLLPTREELDSIAALPDLPVVLLHANPSAYEKPVIANVLPSHTGLAEMVAAWARSVGPGKNRTVEVAAMKPEADGPSIRRERTDAVIDGIREAGFTPKVLYVKDYSGASAGELFDSCAGAGAYVCLSDSIAVHLRQLMRARGAALDPPILGFDGDTRSTEIGIATISQDLPDAARRVFKWIDGFTAFGTGENLAKEDRTELRFIRPTASRKAR